MKKSFFIFSLFIILIISLIFSLDTSNKKFDSFFYIYKKTNELISLNENLDFILLTDTNNSKVAYIEKKHMEIKTLSKSILENDFFVNIENKNIKNDFSEIEKQMLLKISYINKKTKISLILDDAYKKKKIVLNDVYNQELIDIYTLLLNDQNYFALNTTLLSKKLNTYKAKNTQEEFLITQSHLCISLLNEVNILRKKAIAFNLNTKLSVFIDDYIKYSYALISSVKMLIWILMFCLYLSLVVLVFYIFQTSKKTNELAAFKNAVQNSDNIVVITNKNYEIKYVNETFENVTGYKLFEVLGKNPSILKSGLQDAKFYEDLNKTISSGKKWTGEFANKNKFNKITYEKASITPIFDKNGDIFEYLAIKLDITKEKEAHKVLLEKEALLAKQSKMSSMREMLESIAHQWRQPLSSISTAASGLKLHNEFNSLDEKNFKELSDAIIDNSLHLSQTLDKFKSFYNTNNEKTIFSIGDSLNKMKELISYKLNEEKIDLIISNSSKTSLEGLENELIQIFLNIVNNCQDAFKKEKINNRKIFIYLSECKNDQYLIEIKDNAKGIKKDIIHNVFDPYFTTKHKSQGTGLGLYMTHESLTNHFNGTISIENTKFEYEDIMYKGAKVIIKIPIKNKN